jgi:ketosteroid isomerase-like protein
MSEPVDIVRRYYDALGRHDLDTAVECWAPGGTDVLPPLGEVRAPEGVRAYFGEVFAAMPDFWLEILSLVAEGDLVAVHWRGGGTFTGDRYQGIRATGTEIRQEGIDLMRIRDGLIQRTDAYWDDANIGRQLGLLPPKNSRRERALLAVFNARTRLKRRRKASPSV